MWMSGCFACEGQLVNTPQRVRGVHGVGAMPSKLRLTEAMYEVKRIRGENTNATDPATEEENGKLSSTFRRCALLYIKCDRSMLCFAQYVTDYPVVRNAVGSGKCRRTSQVRPSADPSTDNQSYCY